MPLRSKLAVLAMAFGFTLSASSATALSFGYDFTNADWNSSDFSLNGSAFWANDGGVSPPTRLRLTDNSGGDAGSAWLNTATVDAGQAWNAEFTFQITFGSGSDPGADGIGFLLQENGTGIVTGFNGGGGLSSPSLAVGIDTYPNAGDVSNFALEVILDGSQVGGDVNLTGIGNSFDDVYQVVMSYDGAGNLGVNVINTNGGANTGVQNFAADLSALDGATLGWSANTGGEAENHDIRTFSGTFVPEPGTTLMLGAGLAGLAYASRRRD